MIKFKRIDVHTAQQLIQDMPETNIIDIRDEQSFQQSHISNARHIHNHNIASFMAEVDPETPLIVCCYHGNSSQQAAQFFAERDFDEVYSLDGGFEHWQAIFPDQCSSGR